MTDVTELPIGIPPRIKDDLHAITDPATDAAKMLARRIMARKKLMAFILYFMDKYKPGWIHREICNALEQFSEDVAAGKSPRLIIEVPPRHGKSEIASRKFPAWHLGRYPDHEIIQTSYAASLATGFSRNVRDLVLTEEFGHLFPDVGVHPDSKAADSWKLADYDAVYTAAGVGGPITGKGAHIGIIDDPVKNREEADSETVRESIKEWYSSTFYTRLAPGGGVLVIMTRWHEDDLVGWLLREHKQENWVRLKFPAVADHDEEYRKAGEALHPERYPLSALNKIRDAVGPRDWLALYQQSPTGAEGDYFARGDFRYYEKNCHPPLNELVIYSAWDFAIGTKEGNDFTVGCVCGVDKDMNLWVLDLHRGRWNARQIIEEIFTVHEQWKPVQYGFERGQISMSLEPFLRESMRTRKIFDLWWDDKNPLIARSDKSARARPLQGMMNMNKVFFPEKADVPWMPDLIGEFLTFPSGVHDDIVDSLAWLGQMLSMFYRPELHNKKSKKMGWREKLEAGQLSKKINVNTSAMGS